ncbi:MAG: DUF559 domain-containing protein [Thermomonas sp.]
MRENPSNLRQRELRQNMTEAEVRLWQALRNRRLLGMKFRRQHRIGPFFVDFVCLEMRLIVELDGSQHLDRHGYDANRTRYLERNGFRVLRFWNDAVFNTPALVIEAISIALKSSPHPPSAPSPVSRERERTQQQPLPERERTQPQALPEREKL